MSDKNCKNRSVKISDEAFEKLKILKMATEISYVDLIELAIENLVEVTALENQKVKAIEALLHDYKPPEETQMSLEEFL
jgi:predicted transcriptional regulator